MDRQFNLPIGLDRDEPGAVGLQLVFEGLKTFHESIFIQFSEQPVPVWTAGPSALSFHALKGGACRAPGQGEE